jgi:hypothetical protein
MSSGCISSNRPKILSIISALHLTTPLPKLNLNTIMFTYLAGKVVSMKLSNTHLPSL